MSVVQEASLRGVPLVNGATTMSVADVKGVDIAGLMFDAGTKNSRLILGPGTAQGSATTQRCRHWIAFVFSDRDERGDTDPSLRSGGVLVC